MTNSDYKSLGEVLDIIKNAFDDFISYQSFLVEVEVKKINKYRQFYYMDLVQIEGGKIVETAKSNIFNPHVMTDFLSEAKISSENELVGKKLLLTLKPSFHKIYGFSFNVLKIHSDYFIGALEKSKKESIEKLKKLGIFENNKALSLGFPSLHLAIITGKESEGFRDFDTIIKESGYNITYDIYLSLVHGEKAAKEVLDTFKGIDTENYDIVAIIRGGGGSEGMNWANDYELSKYICELSIPVMSAVGHTVDKNIIDMTSKFDCKTPSEAASILINIYREYEDDILDYTDIINKNIKARIKDYSILLSHLFDTINVSIRGRFKTYLAKIDGFNVIQEYIKNQFRNIKIKLDTFDSIIRNNDPSKIIAKGYNLVYDTSGKIKLDYHIGEKYIMSSKSYNYKIDILEKTQKR